jgi:hypothetical protein
MQHHINEQFAPVHLSSMESLLLAIARDVEAQEAKSANNGKNPLTSG